MKTKILIFLMIICTALTSCGYSEQEMEDVKRSSYQSGYEEELNDAYDIGYEDGRRFGIRQSEEIYWDILDDARNCPPEYAEWSVYEAWNNVLLYQEEPEAISEEDVLSSAMVLAYFCRYLDEFSFETDFNPWEYYY